MTHRKRESSMLDEDRTVIYRLAGEDYRQIVLKDDLPYLLDEAGVTIEDAEILPLSEATADELANHIGNLLEDANYHSFTGVADKVLEGLRESRFSDDQRLRVIQILGDVLTDLI